MKDEALRLALEALNDRASQMKWQKAREAVEQALEQERALQALHDENERLGLYKDAYGQPEPEPVKVMGFDCVCGRRMVVESDNGIVASPPKREWQGLTDVDVSKILDEQNGFYTFEKCFNFAKAIEAKLKEKNHDQ